MQCSELGFEKCGLTLSSLSLQQFGLGMSPKDLCFKGRFPTHSVSGRWRNLEEVGPSWRRLGHWARALYPNAGSEDGGMPTPPLSFTSQP